MDVLRSDIFEINLVDLCADFDIMRHLRWCDVIVNRQFRMRFQLSVIAGRAGKLLVRSFCFAFFICFLNLLNYLKQAGTSWNPISFQGRRDSKADGFFSTAGVCNHKIGSHRVKISFPTFH